jgi:dihydrofolate reductase
MKRICYVVAASLDGYIAGPNGEFDWIPHDPDVDFAALAGRFDTLVMGRRSFELTLRQGQGGMPGMQVVVLSRTLRAEDYPNVTLVADNAAEAMARLRARPGKDIWLFGGGDTFRSLLSVGLVDTVEVAIVPVLLGGGLPLLPPPAASAKLTLTGHQSYKKSGIVMLEYAVRPAAA